MLRWITLAFVTLVAAQPALAADQLVVHGKSVHARRQLPPGLPRPHYHYRTTIVDRPPPPPVAVVRDPDVLISTFSTPILLPGSSTLPGYYGRPFDFNYPGAYYGGPNLPYFFRLPYACGVLGYC